MEKIVPIKDASLSRPNNAELLGFYQETSKLMVDATVEKISCTAAVMTRFTAAIAALQDLVKRSSKSLLTDEIRAKDEERDQMVAYCISLIDATAKSPFAGNREFAIKLQSLIDVYRGITKDPYVEETGQIRGFIGVLREHEAMVAEMQDLGSVLDMLETCNDRVEELMSMRLATIPKSENDAVRAELEAVYGEVVIRANSALYLLPSAEATTFAAKQNANIDRTNAVYNQRMGRLKAEREKEEMV